MSMHSPASAWMLNKTNKRNRHNLRDGYTYICLYTDRALVSRQAAPSLFRRAASSNASTSEVSVSTVTAAWSSSKFDSPRSRRRLPSIASTTSTEPVFCRSRIPSNPNPILKDFRAAREARAAAAGPPRRPRPPSWSEKNAKRSRDLHCPPELP